MKEEVFQPYPKVRDATSFRSTWLASSFKAMRERGLMNRYLDNLPKRFHDQVLHSVAGSWLPVEVAVAHYEAMDRLQLDEAEMIKIGLEVTDRFHSGLFSTVFTIARAAGVTPWTILGHTQKMWDKTWVGGGVAIFKSGTKDARGEIVGWPCSRVRYCRIAMRGVMLGTVSLFCRKASVVEIPRYCTETTLGYRMQWE